MQRAGRLCLKNAAKWPRLAYRGGDRREVLVRHLLATAQGIANLTAITSCTPGGESDALMAFFYLARQGLFEADAQGAILAANPTCGQLLQSAGCDFDGANLFGALARLVPDLAQQVAAFADPYGIICEGLALHRGAASSEQGELILALTLAKLEGGRLVGSVTDITARVRGERDLRRSKAWINSVVTGITDCALLSLDYQGVMQGWNSSVGRLTGFDATATEGRSYTIFYPKDGQSAARALERLEEADRNGWSLDEGWRRRADASRFWASCLIAPLPAEPQAPNAERGYSLIIRDITDRRNTTEELRRTESCDHLTGLANRRAFFEAAELELERWLRNPLALSVVLVNVDQFKKVNETYGRPAGDSVLRHLAAGLGAVFRAVDVAARLEDDEFAVLLPGAPAEGATAVAARLCTSIGSRAVEVDGELIRYAVSAGVATMEAGVASLDALIKRACAALSEAKSLGGNGVQRWRPSPSKGAPLEPRLAFPGARSA